MSELTRKTGYLALLASFLCFADGAFGGPVLAVIAVPEPSFPLEFGLTAAGFAGLLLLFRKRRAGPSQNR